MLKYKIPQIVTLTLDPFCFRYLMVNIQNKNRNHQFSNDCDYILYSKRDLNPHSRNGQGILSPSCLPIPPFEHPRRELSLIHI